MELRRIIAGYEGDAPSRDALRLAAMLAREGAAELILAHVYREEALLHVGGADHRLAARAAAVEVLARAETELPYGARAELRPVPARSPVQGLHDLAVDEDADVVVLGTSRRGALELHAVGSVAERLLHGAPCAVAVAPRGFASESKPGLHVIGVAFDGSDESRQALAAASDLALRTGATLRLIGVAEPLLPTAGVAGAYGAVVPVESIRDALQADAEAAADGLPAQLRPAVVTLQGDPAALLCEHGTPLSLLVMGSRGYGPVRRTLLGSVSAPVVRAAPCPVLVIPRAPARSAVVPPAIDAAG